MNYNEEESGAVEVSGGGGEQEGLIRQIDYTEATEMRSPLQQQCATKKTLRDYRSEPTTRSSNERTNRRNATERL